MGLKSFLVGVLVGCLLFVGCASTFTYKYYGIEPASFEGRLLGPKPENDLPFAACAPQPGKPRPCVVVFSDAWFKLKADYQTLEAMLQRCQKDAPK